VDLVHSGHRLAPARIDHDEVVASPMHLQEAKVGQWRVCVHSRRYTRAAPDLPESYETVRIALDPGKRSFYEAGLLPDGGSSGSVRVCREMTIRQVLDFMERRAQDRTGAQARVFRNGKGG